MRPNSEFYDSIKAIARHFSPLVPKTQSTSAFDEILVEFDTLIKQGVQNQRLVELRRDLLPVMGSKLANSLTPSEAAYLDCVWNLELLRVGNGSFAPLLSYLESYPLVQHSGTAVQTIVNRCFTLYLDQMVAAPASLQRESALVQQMHQLLAAFVHRSAFVRKAAEKYIAEMLERFPQLLWNARSLFAVLDLLDALGKACFDLQRLYLTLPNTELRIVLPEIENQRCELVQEVSRLSRQWLMNAFKRAPSEVAAMLQSYFGSFVTSNQAHYHHLGYSLGIEMGILGPSGAVKSAPLSNISELNSEQDALRSVEVLNASSSSFANSLSVKSHYLGEIQGMMALLEFMESNRQLPGGRTAEQLIDTLVMRLMDHIARRANREPTDEDEAALAVELHRAAAVLITQHRNQNNHVQHRISLSHFTMIRQVGRSVLMNSLGWLCVCVCRASSK